MESQGDVNVEEHESEEMLAIEDKIRTARCHFRHACHQILHLNRRLKEISFRYKKAKKLGQRSFWYTQRQRLTVVEGVRKMYHDYAMEKVQETEDLQQKFAAMKTAQSI